MVPHACAFVELHIESKLNVVNDVLLLCCDVVYVVIKLFMLIIVEVVKIY